MSSLQSHDNDIQKALDIARDLARQGVPIFVAKPRKDSTPEAPKYLPPLGWQRTVADPAVVDTWEPGDALAALMGVVCDGLDVDPQNGGDETADGIRQAGLWPRSYGQQSTPSGGTHDLIARTRLNKGSYKGIDLQAGADGGEGRGFLWIAPTVRKSKTTGEVRPYSWVVEPDVSDTDGDDSGEQIVPMFAPATPKPKVGVAVNPLTDRRFTTEEAAEYCKPQFEELRQAQDGTINDTLNRTAVMLGHFVPAFWSVEQVTKWLLEAQLRPHHDGNDRDAQRTIRSGLEAGMREPYTFVPPPEVVKEQEVLGAVEQMLAKMLDRDGLDDVPDLAPLIEGLLDLNTPARLNGPSGSGKSFISLDMAGCVSQGIDFHGLKTTQSKVVYLVAEGLSGVRRRVRAWERHYGRKMTDVLFYPEPVQTTSTEWEVFIQACERIAPGLIIVDTQARVTVGVDENSAKELGVVVSKVEALRAATGACVLLVHHTGHNGSHGRGSTAGVGAMNSELGVVKDGQVVTLKTTKQKDREEAEDMKFRLSQVEPDDDWDGDRSAVLVPLADREEAKGEKFTVEDSRVVYVMELFGEASMAQMVKSYCGPGGPPVKGNSENTARFAIKRAIERNVIKQTDGGTAKRPMYVLTPLSERMNDATE